MAIWFIPNRPLWVCFIKGQWKRIWPFDSFLKSHLFGGHWLRSAGDTKDGRKRAGGRASEPPFSLSSSPSVQNAFRACSTRNWGEEEALINVYMAPRLLLQFLCLTGLRILVLRMRKGRTFGFQLQFTVQFGFSFCSVLYPLPPFFSRFVSTSPSGFSIIRIQIRVFYHKNTKPGRTLSFKCLITMDNWTVVSRRRS